MANAVHRVTPFSSQALSSSTMGVDDLESMSWPSSTTSAYQPFDQNSNSQPIAGSYESRPGDDPQFSQNNVSYSDNYNLSYATQFSDPSRPRSYSGSDLTGLPAGIVTTQAYPPEAYQIEPPTQLLESMGMSDQESNGNLMQMSNDYNNPYNPLIKVEDHAGYRSPYSTMTRASTPHDSMSPYPTGSDPGGEIAVDKEQPYAQLIYQALLHADGHTMILRDIYDWFKKHTDKATVSETKGWQNSIRHNLSMNGVSLPFVLCLVANPTQDTNLVTFRPLKKWTSRAKNPRRALCGASVLTPFVKASNLPPAIAPRFPISAATEATTHNPSVRPLAPKAGTLRVAACVCAGRIGCRMAGAGGTQVIRMRVAGYRPPSMPCMSRVWEWEAQAWVA